MARPEKGSQEARDKMAAARAARGTKSAFGATLPEGVTVPDVPR